MTITRRMNYLPSFFDDFFNRDVFNWNTSNFSNTNTTIPAVNIKETSDHYDVEVAAPGMNKKDFKVQLDGNLLTISSEREEQQESGNQQQEGNWKQPNEERYISREFSYQSFQRTFTLQKGAVDADNIQARYKDGVLHLLIPKKEEAKQKPPRVIEIV